MVFRLLLAVTELHQNAQARFSKVCIAKYIAILLRSVVIRKDWCSAFDQCHMCLIPVSTLDLCWICTILCFERFFPYTLLKTTLWRESKVISHYLAMEDSSAFCELLIRVLMFPFFSAFFFLATFFRHFLLVARLKRERMVFICISYLASEELAS